MQCPHCKGAGKTVIYAGPIDFNEFRMVLTEPITKKCIICAGTGTLIQIENGKGYVSTWRNALVGTQTMLIWYGYQWR